MPHQHPLPIWLKPFYISASVLFCWFSDVPCRDVGPSPPAVSQPRRRWQSSCLLETEWLLWRRWQVMTYVEGYVVDGWATGWILVLRLDPGRLAINPKFCPHHSWGDKGYYIPPPKSFLPPWQQPPMQTPAAPATWFCSSKADPLLLAGNDTSSQADPWAAATAAAAAWEGPGQRAAWSTATQILSGP